MDLNHYPTQQKIDSQNIKFHIWDTYGKEIYRPFITSFYREASIALMVYSIDKRESFIHINKWLKEVRLQSSPDIEIILIGNKNDLEEQRWRAMKKQKNFKMKINC